MEINAEKAQFMGWNVDRMSSQDGRVVLYRGYRERWYVQRGEIIAKGYYHVTEADADYNERWAKYDHERVGFATPLEAINWVRDNPIHPMLRVVLKGVV
jgi:hypothetical protein